MALALFMPLSAVDAIRPGTHEIDVSHAIHAPPLVAQRALCGCLACETSSVSRRRDIELVGAWADRVMVGMSRIA